MYLPYVDVKNPAWANPERTMINVEVNFDHLPEEVVTFTASPDDNTAHGPEIYAACIAGDYGPIAEFVPPPPPTVEELALGARFVRNQLLAESDWTQLPDVPPSVKEAWASYRQALRDITQQPGFPAEVVWPTRP